MNVLLDGWIDVTPIASAYEIHFRPSTKKYRHRLRRVTAMHAILQDRGDGVRRTIDCGAWYPGKPPPYPI